jgi:hypothetical protein
MDRAPDSNVSSASNILPTPSQRERGSTRQRRKPRALDLSVLFTFGIALTAFGAVYTPEALGYLAASPGVLLLLLCTLLSVITQSRQRHVVTKDALLLLGWGLMVSTASLLLFGLDSQFVSKTVTLLILCVVWMSPLLCFEHVQTQHLRKGLVAALVISATGYVLEDLARGAWFPALHSFAFGGEFVDYSSLRLRGFMQENSHFAAVVSRAVLLLYIIWESSRRFSSARLSIFLFALICLLAFLDSKGAAVSVVLTVALVNLNRRQIPYLILLMPVILWAASWQLAAIAFDLENFTSASTRATLFVTALASAICDPFGVGYYGFYPAMQTFGGWAMDILSDGLPLVLTEAVDIIENLNNVSTKSTALDFLMLYGISFIWVMVRLVRRMDLKDLRVRACLIYLLLSSLSTAGHDSIWFFLGLAVLCHCFPRRGIRARTAPARRPLQEENRQQGTTLRAK